MTKNLRALLRAQMLITWRSFRDGMGGGKSKWGLLLLPLMLLGFVPLLFMMVMLFFTFFVTGKSLGYPEFVLMVAMTVGQLVCLSFGVFYVISSFYFSKDITMLIPMPIRPGEIVLSKFIGIMLGEYLTMAPVVLPAVVIYGIFAGVSWTFLPFALIIFLLLPVAPLVIAALFSIVLMRVTNLRRNRDLYRVMGGLIGLAIGLGFNYFSRLGARGNFDPGSSEMAAMIGQLQTLLQNWGKYIPTSTWATNALKAGAPAFGFGSFILFAAVALAALAGMVWVAEKLFYGGAVGGEETRASGKKLSKDDLARETAQARTPLWALFVKEFKLLNRTPSFLMQALVPLIIMPFFVIMPMTQEQEIGSLIAKAGANANSPLVPAIGVGVVLFMASMSSVAATAVSREGKHFWISRSLPVMPRVQVHAKLLHHMIFAVLNVVLVLAGLGFFKVLTPLTFVYVLIGGLTAGAAMGYSGMIVDLMRPNLKWTDPQQAMKGNYNVLFGMLLIWLMIGVVAAVTAGLYFLAPPLIMPGVILIFAVEALLLGKAAGAMADKRYVEIED
ncbi:MAG: hypothetical protein K0R39_3589 [Symbiobacteriaceae bacterium]|jgi:ABC-2 type transport system permease protein|nr:hypothetical protein [Symbiobacteriaceae bacterium]